MNLKEEKSYQLRQYKRLLRDLQQVIATTLEGIDDEGFEPSTAIETHLLRAATLAGSLTSPPVETRRILIGCYGTG